MLLLVHLLFHLVQDLFHVFLNNFEMAIFLLFFNLFTILFLYYINAIFKKREALIKWFFTVFVRFKHRCKMSGVISSPEPKAHKVSL